MLYPRVHSSQQSFPFQLFLPSGLWKSNPRLARTDYQSQGPKIKDKSACNTVKLILSWPPTRFRGGAAPKSKVIYEVCVSNEEPEELHRTRHYPFAQLVHYLPGPSNLDQCGKNPPLGRSFFQREAPRIRCPVASCCPPGVSIDRRNF